MRVDAAIVDEETSLNADGLNGLGLIFKDDFAPDEAATYEIRVDPGVSGSNEPLGVEQIGAQDEVGDLFRVTAGEKVFTIGHELEPLDVDYNAQVPKDLYVRLDDSDGGTRFFPLSYLYFNIAEHQDSWYIPQSCEHLFVISPGFPSAMKVDANALTVKVHLEYPGEAQTYCPKPSNEFVLPTAIDFYHASVSLTFYRDSSRVDAHTTVRLARGFYNHNGFPMGGVETSNSRPRVLFGDESHTVLQGALWADTEETTDRTEFVQLEGDNWVFRRAATRDAGAPFQTLATSKRFFDYYVVEDTEGSAAFLYFPDFRKLAYQNMRNEGTETIPVNMIGAGPSVPLMVANPILISQTHLGNVGDVWGPIAPGSYDYRMRADLQVPFQPADPNMYDELAVRLSTPLRITVLSENGGSIPTPSATMAAPSTSTPYPSPTPTPTPAPASCAPPERPRTARRMQAGAVLPRFSNVWFFHLKDGIGTIDNTRNNEYVGHVLPPVEIAGPFSVSVEFKTSSGALTVGGRIAQPWQEWWEQNHTLTFELSQWGPTLGIRDGRAEDSYHTIDVPEAGSPYRLQVQFLERCGKQLKVFNSDGELVNFTDVTQLTDQRLPDGLFPDGIAYFEIVVAPGSQMTIYDFSVSIP